LLAQGVVEIATSFHLIGRTGPKKVRDNVF
jgi:hypothetical protein